MEEDTAHSYSEYPTTDPTISNPSTPRSASGCEEGNGIEYYEEVITGNNIGSPEQ